MFEVTPEREVRGEYLRPAEGGVACVRHEPVGECRGGVVIVPPFGWEDAASYHERYAWGQHLAERGFAVARIDLPGTGDSGGSARDAGRLAAWLRAIADAAARLRDDAGCASVTAIGVGLGALLAVLAAGVDAPLDGLVLWNAPATGRSAMRKLKAFARLQEPDDAPGTLPDGWLEVGGFVLSAELIAELGAADLRDAELGGVRRALLLRSKGGEDPAALADRLRGAGAEVEVGEGPGYPEMMDHPQFYAPPEATIVRVDAWLDAAPGPRPPAEGAAPGPVPAAAVLELPGGVREEFVTLARPAGPLLGVLASPAAPDGDLCAVFFNAGALRRSGPNRMWTEAARRWAVRGVPVLRIDLPGLGDSAGDASLVRENAAFHRAEMNEAIVAALDDLERRGAGRRFVLVGLCSGAYHALHTAVRDERAVAVGMLNPRTLRWGAGTELHLRHQRMAERLTLRRAKDLVTGRVSGAAVRRAVREAGVLVRARVRRDGAAAAPAVDELTVAGTFDLLRDRGVPVLLGFSAGEPVREELDGPELRDRGAWPRLRLVDLPGSSHELRSVTAQRRAHALLDELLDAVAEPAAAA